MTSSQEQLNQVVDVAATGVTVASLAGYLPAVAALFSIVWIGIRIYDRIRYGRAPNNTRP